MEVHIDQLLTIFAFIIWSSSFPCLEISLEHFQLEVSFIILVDDTGYCI